MPLERALRAESGVVCTVGAGGKKTTLYRLADRLATERNRRVVLTATVRIPIFDSHVETVHRTTTPATALETVDRWPVGLVPERDGPDRYRGYAPERIDTLATTAAVDVILVKADGARMRSFKAPGDREPRIPRSATTVIPVASLGVVGNPLTDEVVHRPERVAALTGRSSGEPIEPDDVATVLTHPQGGCKGVPPDATVVPLLNKADAVDDEREGRAIAEAILDRSDRIDRVVVSRMTAADPIVAVVE